jgi:hypothetical protein
VSRNVSTNADILCDEAGMLRDTMNGTLGIIYRQIQRICIQKSYSKFIVFLDVTLLFTGVSEKSTALIFRVK